MAYGRGKKEAANPKQRAEAEKAVNERLDRKQMKDLLLKKLADQTPLRPEDILSLLSSGATEEEAKKDSEPQKKAPPKALDRMTSATKLELEKDFRQFDKNGDGSITLDEFITIMHMDVSGHETPAFDDAELVALFEAMDTDGGGTVCYAEFAEQWALDRALEAEELKLEGEEEQVAA